MKNLYLLLLLIISATLTACSTVTQDGAPSGYVDFDAIPNAVPRVLPESKYGNPSSYRVMGQTYYVLKSAEGFDQRGIASWYGTKFYRQPTSTREPYNLYAMTAAMRTLPIPTFVQVTNLVNGKQIIVEVNDRGPFDDNRLIDLSYAAAGKLGILQKGTGLVEVRAIDPSTWNSQQTQIASVEKPQLLRQGNPQLYIQVGAFDNEANANRILAELHQQILQPNRISPEAANGQTIYRVQIGPLASIDASDVVSNRLKRLGYTPMAVIE